MVVSRSVPDRQDVDRILAAVRVHATRRNRPALVVLVGLPGSGKSRVAEELRARTGAVVLESDDLRQLLFTRRTYSAEESRRLFAAIHQATDELLSEGVSVVSDATNLAEAERVPLYRMAEQRHARVVLVHVTAPGPVIRRRLARRDVTGTSRSEADVRVYERMRSRFEEVARQHHVVDTSRDVEPALGRVAKEMTEP